MTDPRGAAPSKLALARFDGSAVWQKLSPEQQAAIGSAALEICAIAYLADRVHDDRDQIDPRIVRAAEAADIDRFSDNLHEAFVDAIPRDAMETACGPLVPASIGDLCRICGCSHHDPCADGCGWAEPGLCTACANQETDDDEFA